MRKERIFVAALVWTAAALVLVGLAALLAWDPYPATERSYDRGTNGLWLGHRWFTGRGVRDDEPVTEPEIEALVGTLARHGIRYAFVHVGPVLEDGRLADAPGPVLGEMLRRAPEVEWLAWLGARVERIPLREARFRGALVETIAGLRDAGFAGVHFDFEPLHDRHPGYLETLDAVRAAFPPPFRISQATPRAGPFGLSFGPLRASFWSEEFYRATMSRTDQTVVMAYDTGLDFTKGYVAFVRHQTGLLGRWACATPGHRLLIGVPSYEDVPTYSDPQVENLRTASLGVRAALEAGGPYAECLEGVAVYAHWVTDESEWRDFERHWIAPGGTAAR